MSGRCGCPFLGFPGGGRSLVSRERIIPALLLVCVIGATVRADMMSQQREIVHRDSACVHTWTTARPTLLSEPLSGLCLDLADLRSPPITFSIDRRARASGTPETPPVRILTDRQNSLELCLYGLIGLGICRSGHWVKRSSLGFVPQWCCGSGPYSIGEGLDVSIDSPCTTAMCSLVQPNCAVQQRLPPHRSRAVVCLWRRSQFTSDVVSPRGPPLF